MIAAKTAELLGTKKEDMIIIEDTRDTIEESEAALELIGDKKFFLVSSASHLTRSVGLFRKKGMKPIPAPTDFLNKSSWRFSMPSSGGLYRSERALYETLGTTWAWLTGRY